MMNQYSEIGDQHVGAAGSPPPARRGLRRLLVRTATKAWDDSLFGESAQAAFWQTLSLPPLLLGLLGSLGYIGTWFGPDTSAVVQARILSAARGVFSRTAIDEIITPKFRSGDFAGGISDGVDRIIGVIDGEPLPAPIRVAVTRNPHGYPMHPEIGRVLERVAGWLSAAGYAVEETEPPPITEPARAWFDVAVTEMKTMLFPLARRLLSPAARPATAGHKACGYAPIFGWRPIPDLSPIYILRCRRSALG